MRVITYTLPMNKSDASQYYEDVAVATDIVLEEGLKITAAWVNEYQEFLLQHKLEELRSKEEYMMEMLTLGVLWLRYSDDAVVLKQISKEVLSKLVHIRQQGGILKPGADFIRGILGTFYLYGEHRPEIVEQVKFSLNNFLKLVHWMEATGEFVQEVKRFRKWSQYLQGISQEKVADFIAESVSFAMWFEEKAIESLGKYTQGIEAYLNKVPRTHRWREDLIFCSRHPLEYHLNMVGAEIMNRAFRAHFVKTKRKAILLPSCMRKRLKGECKAHKKMDVFDCAGCESDCQIHQIKELGSLYGYEVLIVPHESSAFSQELVKEGDLGVIGVACVINLLAGGWKAKDLGIAAQCVLLNYCGCKNHWDEEGFSTAIDMGQLHRIMNIPQEAKA